MIGKARFETKVPVRVTGETRTGVRYLPAQCSSALLNSGSHRATISCCIWWVPSKMSRSLGIPAST